MTIVPGETHVQVERAGYCSLCNERPVPPALIGLFGREMPFDRSGTIADGVFVWACMECLAGILAQGYGATVMVCKDVP